MTESNPVDVNATSMNKHFATIGILKYHVLHTRTLAHVHMSSSPVLRITEYG
jgi:hypothetical protein